MPLFQVRCPKCGREKEYIDKSMQTVIESKCCTNCGANFTPIISSSNFALVGDGWSKQGYAKP